MASYNAGAPHGRWIDADGGADEIGEQIAAMLAESPQPCAEEWAIHDFEMGGLELSESEDIDTVAALAEALAEHGAAYAAYVGTVGAEVATVEDFEDRYAGHHDNEEAFAAQLVDDLYDVEQVMGRLRLRYYADYAPVARDLFMGDYTSVEADGGVYVFRAC
jgi:antirestriction protein